MTTFDTCCAHVLHTRLIALSAVRLSIHFLLRGHVCSFCLFFRLVFPNGPDDVLCHLKDVFLQASTAQLQYILNVYARTRMHVHV